MLGESVLCLCRFERVTMSCMYMRKRARRRVCAYLRVCVLYFHVCVRACTCLPKCLNSCFCDASRVKTQHVLFQHKVSRIVDGMGRTSKIEILHR